MPANVESMMYHGAKPWHGLGTNVEEAPSSEEAIHLAGLNWEVLSEPVFTRINEVEAPCSGWFANVRSDNHRVLGIVTKKYKIIQNVEAFNFTDALLGENVRYETAGSLAEGRRIWLLARLPEIDLLGDRTEMYLVFTNSHDGKASIRASITPIRVVCQNTLNIALSSAKRSWNVTHTGDINGKLTEAQETLGLAEEYITALKEKASVLANKSINENTFSELVHELFPLLETDVPSIINNNILRLQQGLFDIYQSPTIGEFRNTAWGALNAVADFANHRTPLRITNTSAERRFVNIVDGHTELDAAVNILNRL